MKLALSIGILLMGFSFTVTQGLMIRELLVIFYGNELSIGLVLGCWLILEAIGSGIIGRLADRWRTSAPAFAGLQVLFALFLPLCLCGVYLSRLISGGLPGEAMGLLAMFHTSFLILAPLALVDGAMFAFGCRAYAGLLGRQAPSIGRVYVLEAVGAIAGGVIFTFVLIPYMLSLQIALTLLCLNLIAALLILFLSWRANGGRRLSHGASLLAVLVLLIGGAWSLFTSGAERAQHWAVRHGWPALDLVYYDNSIYGNVLVIHQERQYTFYADGIPILTSPMPDLVLIEETVHIPMLFVPDAEQALVVSGGVGGVLSELLKYPLERVDYAELDPLLIDAVHTFSTPLTAAELSDPRVQVEHVDGRLLVKRRIWQSSPAGQDRYDLIIVNLPYPSSLQINRFYTVEFFSMARQLLTPEGILVVGCPGSLTYMSEELRSLNTMIYETLSHVYPHVRPIPGDHTLWLASSASRRLNEPASRLVQHWEAYGPPTQALTSGYLDLKLSQRRLDWYWGALDRTEALDATRERRMSLVNRDLHPVGLFYGLSYWNALYSPEFSRLLAAAGQLTLAILVIPILACGLLVAAFARLTEGGKRLVIPYVIATTGFAGITADLIVIFAFQTLYGYVYHMIALLITAFVAGLSLGGSVMTRRIERGIRDREVLLMLEAAMLAFWALLPAVLVVLYARADSPLAFSAIQGLLLLFSAIAGFLVGAQFPLANHIWLRHGDMVAGSAGTLYAADLAGAFAGAIIISVVLMPVLGIPATCLLVGVAKLSSLSLLIIMPRR